jgi:hypothetical protein
MRSVCQIRSVATLRFPRLTRDFRMHLEEILRHGLPIACLRLVALLLVANSGTHAQNVQFLPETDVYLKLNPSWRTFVQAKNDQDAGGSPELSIGPSVQLYVKPLLKLKHITVFDLDDSKKRALVLETGYCYITAPDTVPENRLEAIATSHFPL